MINDYYNDVFDISMDLFDQIMDDLARHQKSVREEAKQKLAKEEAAKPAANSCNCNCRKLPEVKNIIFNDPVTVVFWNDGTKTIVRASNGDKFSKELGIVYSIFKKLYGPNTSAAISKLLAKSQDQADIKAAKRSEKTAKKTTKTAKAKKHD